MEDKDLVKLIDARIARAMALSVKKYGDTPTDANQLVPKQYADTIAATGISSATTVEIQSTGADVNIDALTSGTFEVGTILLTKSGGDTRVFAGVGGAAGSADIRFQFDLETATGSTKGFFYVPTVNGTPSGTPSAAATGIIPLIYDRAANKLWAYNGAWLSVTLT